MSQVETDKTRLEPVRKSVTVEASIEHAFKVFTERLGEWWPIRSHSVHVEDALLAGMETREGGEIYEVWREGREVWGEITTWAPPQRLVFTWHPGLEPTETTEVSPFCFPWQHHSDRTRASRLGNARRAGRRGQSPLREWLGHDSRSFCRRRLGVTLRTPTPGPAVSEQ